MYKSGRQLGIWTGPSHVILSFALSLPQNYHLIFSPVLSYPFLPYLSYPTGYLPLCSVVRTPSWRSMDSVCDWSKCFQMKQTGSVALVNDPFYKLQIHSNSDWIYIHSILYSNEVRRKKKIQEDLTNFKKVSVVFNVSTI